MLFNRPNGFKEGELMCKWMERRLLVQNKNVLGANLGPTGSGKSYRDLRIAELWYQNYLKRPFPYENICFGTQDAMKRITSGELKRGDLIIYEEAGANMGSLDFQDRTAKTFTYVLQSFRSMNIGILFNLPYLSMLNKSARMLLHYSIESIRIDKENKLNVGKLTFHQVNQGTGKLYKKLPVVIVGGKPRKINEVAFGMPSKELVDVYEQKKSEYLARMQKDFMDSMKKDEDKKNGIRPLTYRQKEVYELLLQGLNQTQIAEKLGVKQGNVSVICSNIADRGWKW